MAAGKHILGKGNSQRVFGTAKVGDRGQIVIPKEAREFFGIEPGDTLLILGKSETGLIVTRPETLNHLAEQGIPVIVIGLPVRYAHSHYCYSALSDLENSVKLAVEVIRGLNAGVLREWEGNEE